MNSEEKSNEDEKSFHYRASNNTGIYGSYQIISDQTPSKPITKISQRKPAKDGNRNGTQILNEWSLDNNCKFHICSGSVVTFIGDAIVNAANERCTGGGYVDHAISKAGGKMLKKYRYKLPVLPNTKDKRCLTGSAVITKSGYGSNDCSLQCQYVIHCVGPNYKVRSKHVTVKQCDKLLYNAYQQCMILGKEYKLKSIGFCLISAGVFRGGQSLKKILKIACLSIYDNIQNEEDKDIYLIGYTEDEIKTLKQVGPKVFGKPDIIYASKKKKKKPKRSSAN